MMTMQDKNLSLQKTGKEAKKLNTNLDPDSYIDLYSRRASEFDGLENAAHAEIMCAQWHEGWWFFQDGCPTYDEGVSDEVFYEWYKKQEPWRG